MRIFVIWLRNKIEGKNKIDPSCHCCKTYNFSYQDSIWLLQSADQNTPIQILFVLFSTEDDYDFLEIHDGKSSLV